MKFEAKVQFSLKFFAFLPLSMKFEAKVQFSLKFFAFFGEK